MNKFKRSELLEAFRKSSHPGENYKGFKDDKKAALKFAANKRKAGYRAKTEWGMWGWIVWYYKK